MVFSAASRIARPPYIFARSGRGLFLALSVAPKVGVPPLAWPRGVPVFDTRKSKLSPGPYPPSVPSWHLRCAIVARVRWAQLGGDVLKQPRTAWRWRLVGQTSLARYQRPGPRPLRGRAACPCARRRARRKTARLCSTKRVLSAGVISGRYYYCRAPPMPRNSRLCLEALRRPAAILSLSGRSPFP